MNGAMQPGSRPEETGAVQAGSPRSSVGPVGKPPRPTASAGELVAAVLKLASALCGLAAAGLFVLPLLRGEVSSTPRLITLSPTSASSSSEPTPASKPGGDEPAASEGEPPPETEKPTREERTAFKGALLSLESQPSGANVRVNGVDQGDTPVTVGLDCVPGRTLVVEFTLRGFQKATHRTPCPRDSLVTVTARLRKGSGKSSNNRK
ncbi:PEGA domain-containing protein [Archangium violaceum]|uniref:PEGA domain-containing protein n=1 Tax=Archangium violaceum TaxID=83451 RepID=UPI00194FCB57|nr:PEGA domain-containing protein [Archangium violaceum]QRN96250.1 PEGA domain-containing protein [Archangium violaceum]